VRSPTPSEERQQSKRLARRLEREHDGCQGSTGSASEQRRHANQRADPQVHPHLRRKIPERRGRAGTKATSNGKKRSECPARGATTERKEPRNQLARAKDEQGHSRDTAGNHLLDVVVADSHCLRHKKA